MSASAALVASYVVTHPEEVARRVERLTAGQRPAFLAALPPEVGALLLQHLSAEQAASTIVNLPAPAAARVLERLPIDVAVSLLRRVAPEDGQRLIEALEPAHVEKARALLAYPPDTAGGVMDPLVLTAPITMSIADARMLVESSPEHLYYYVYAVDASNRLAGVFDLAELYQATHDAPLRAIVTTEVVWLAASAPLKTVFAHPGWRTFDALPVVGAEHRFLGVLRHRRMRQLLEHDRPAGDAERTMHTVVALGEIYWLGLCGLLQGIAVTAADPTGARGRS